MPGRRTALLVGALVAVGVTALLAFHLVDPVELPVRDAALRLLPRRPAANSVVVAIDETSLRALGAWPWPRPLLAELVDRAAKGGARGVILDVLLTDERPGDEQLAAALRRVPSVAVSVLDERGQWLLPAPPLRSAAVAAHGNFEVDHDGILRRLASTKQSRDRALTALPVEAATIVTGAPVPVGATIAPAFRTAARAIPRISAAELLRDPAIASRLRGKLVFVGPTALALGDRVLTPTSGSLPDPGVTVHAAATESLIAGDCIRPAPPLLSGLLAGLLAAAVLLVRGSGARRLIVAATLLVLIAGSGALLLGAGGLALPFLTLSGTVIATSVSIEARLTAATLRRSRNAASQMERGLGISRAAVPEVGPRLEEIAIRIVERREQDAESKRLLAHELRTPLASMRGLTQLLGGFELSESERRRVTSLLESEAGKLQSMVNGLLDLERLPLRDFAASSAVVDLGPLVRERIAFLGASAGRPLEVSAPDGLVVRADPVLIERLVDNLVGNALKYTPAPSPITIAARQEAGSAVLEVADRGPGISGAERERIFQRFFRGSTAGGTEGLGLGLSLVGEIARWHHGAITLEERAGGGSLFRLILPLATTPLMHAGGR
jgi:signal transduction histidine kinase